MTLKDLGEIAVAWVRAFHPTPEQHVIAQERLAVCEMCQYREWSNTMNWWKCGACGCPLHKKIYSPKPGPDACPYSKWPR